MITGIVTPKLQALLHVRLRGNLSTQEVEVVIDTGFTGYLTLPLEIIQRLGLDSLNASDAMLADGSSVRFNLYSVIVEWEEVQRNVEVIEAANVPLLGMSLLRGCSVHADVWDGGPVEIEVAKPSH